ncbi:MAG TPA: methionine adenosyltransferase [Thermoanaerobaculia bacterium]|nr:methionine adenosyltransferase [Thermoanaerobaculia bacterium]
MPHSHVFTSESVTEGHPDKVCDYVADSILDACFEQDPRSRVACEVLAKSHNLVLAGEISTNARFDYAEVARRAIEEIGYTDLSQPFNHRTTSILLAFTSQSNEIAQGVDEEEEKAKEQGAGDQGVMFGYATDETPELMPLPILLAHRLARGLADDRRSGRHDWLRPDGKTQVTVRYEGIQPKHVERLVVSTMHAPEKSQEEIREYVHRELAPRCLGDWYRDDIQIFVNPTGAFSHGGPSADAGVTGRKIIVDTYGGMGRHGGGAFSGKDPSKVDRSGAYFCRHVARQVVREGLARRAEVQVAYAIGVANPVSVYVQTHGTGPEEKAARFVEERFDFRPRAIIEQLGLLRPIYRQTTNYGHFGRPGLPWEA